ncbi:MAG: winged helix-turn-helix transcriptional regulator [Desulfovibrionaceae bacterium]|nr:winged helix-turn-helix transcriptional regulator [Desulfovibrionaceae bacterium]
MEHLAQSFKGLSEPIRLRALRLMEHGKLCICDLVHGLGLPQSTVSRHMAFLKQAGWVTSQRQGQWVYYSLAEPQSGLQAMVLEALRQNLPAMEEAQRDYIRLMRFLETKHEDRCPDRAHPKEAP